MSDNQQKRETVSFTPEIDKRIIEGFLGDREAMLKELAGTGFSRRVVLKRAASLGLTDQFIKNFHLSGTDVGDVAVRRCLKCNEPFASMGPHNRMCRRCQVKG
jgi:hypothetical protein